MRRGLLLLLMPLTCLQTAWASDWSVDWTPDTTRILGDPAFLPFGGQIAGSFTYTHSANSYDYSAGPNAYINTWNKTANTFLPSLSYGITDDLSVSANLGWGNGHGTDSYIFDRLVVNNSDQARLGRFAVPAFSFVPTQVQASYQSTGPNNPEFAITYRAIDQRSAPVNVDLSASYAPDVFPAKDPGGDNTGTLALGGQRATLEASVSHETRFFTARAYATFGYDGRRNIGQPGGSVVLRADARPDYAVGIQTETRLASWLALNIGISAQRSASYDLHEFPGAGGAETLRPGGDISPYIGVAVPLLDRRVAGELIYQHDFIGDETITSAFEATQRYYNQQSNLIVARLLFVFGVR